MKEKSAIYTVDQLRLCDSGWGLKQLLCSENILLMKSYRIWWQAWIRLNSEESLLNEQILSSCSKIDCSGPDLTAVSDCIIPPC